MTRHFLGLRSQEQWYELEIFLRAVEKQETLGMVTGLLMQKTKKYGSRTKFDANLLASTELSK